MSHHRRGVFRKGVPPTSETATGGDDVIPPTIPFCVTYRQSERRDVTIRRDSRRDGKLQGDCMKAFSVIALVSNWHGHITHSTQVAGWMTEHHCHLRAHWLAEQHPYTSARCEIARHHFPTCVRSAVVL